MVEKRAWTDREFAFDQPTWMFPNIVERVRGTPARVEDIVNGLTTSVLTQRMSDNTWSVQENIGHLLDLESLWAARLDELLSGAAELTAWEPTNRASWAANHNANSLDAILKGYRDTRMRFVERLDGLTDAQIESSALHPRLQTPMRTIDLAVFVAEHDDYHLARISWLKREIGQAL